MTETDFEGLIRRLAEGRVDFILVGGVAAILHGSARVTFDVDAVYSRSAVNIKRLVDTLEKLIALKRAAGRPKDNEILAELEALLQERERRD